MYFFLMCFFSILGAFYAAVRIGFSENLHAVFCLAENSVSERSTRPDDIHILYSGKSVEINNTVRLLCNYILKFLKLRKSYFGAMRKVLKKSYCWKQLKTPCYIRPNPT